MKLNSENDVGESSSGISGVTELDATIQSYKEFEVNVFVDLCDATLP